MMLMILINNTPVEIEGIELGQVIDETGTAIVNQYFADEASKLVQNEPTIEAAFQKLQTLTLSNIPIPSLPDPIGEEAFKIAKDIIRTKLISEGLPLIDLDIHAEELARRKPKLRAEALARLKARAITRSNIFSELEIQK